VKPIFRGLWVALIGFAATCLLIQALTAAWFGNYWNAAAEIVASVILFIIFRKTSRSYLAFLETRINNDQKS